MEKTEQSQLRLRLSVHQSVMALPRCLQVLSRRGYTLLHLQTEPATSNTVVLTMTLYGERDWHEAIPDLLNKIIGVEQVAVQEDFHHA